ncbi:MAG: hypothetical protein AAF528_01425 [Cyanobacteria bacterium P01_C01_bin.121]
MLKTEAASQRSQQPGTLGPKMTDSYTQKPASNTQAYLLDNRISSWKMRKRLTNTNNLMKALSFFRRLPMYPKRKELESRKMQAF